MKSLALAALAATYWLTVATARLILHPPPPAAERITFAPPPAPAASSAPRGRVLRVRPLPPDATCALDWGDDRSPDPKPLRKSALIAGMKAVRPQVDACYAREDVPGTAIVNVKIFPDGSVRSATVTGKFRLTPMGTCVEAAVKTARFPPSLGMVTRYSFQLR